jgi:glycosyltransferase involved in cell wall biosynthesis
MPKIDFPKISIVTPSYNQGKFVEDNIKSIINQNYPYYEHIIFDNCSNDNTITIFKKYPHLKWISEPDKGQSDALNKALKMTTGNIIGWLNADDYYLPFTFEKVIRNFVNDDLDGLYSNLEFVDKNKKNIRTLYSHKPVKWLSLFHCFIPSPTFFFSKKIIDNGIYFDIDLHIAMDQEFFAHILFTNFNVLYINDCFSAFRWHENNKSIDDKNVREIQYREGYEIFKRYSGIKINTNKISLFGYKIITNILLIYRKYLKIITRL